MFRQLSERLHESLDGRWQIRAEPWSLWEKRGDAFVEVVTAPTMATLAAAVVASTIPEEEKTRRLRELELAMRAR